MTGGFLVTGGAGRIGSAVVRRLVATGAQVRALSRKPRGDGLGARWFQGDLAEPESLRAALRGVERLFLYPVLDSLPEVVNEAEAAGVRRVVLFTGAWAAGLTSWSRASWTLRRYRAGEAAVESGGVPEWTVLRPAPFASNLLWWSASIRQDGVVRAPYADGACPLIHPDDIAEAAVAALTEPGHHGRHYTLTGPALLTQREQAAAIEAALGRPVRFEELTEQQWRTSVDGRLRPGIIDDLALEWSSTAADPGCALPVLDTVRTLTGRPARSVAQWTEENADSFR